MGLLKSHLWRNAAVLNTGDGQIKAENVKSYKSILIKIREHPWPKLFQKYLQEIKYVLKGKGLENACNII